MKCAFIVWVDSMHQSNWTDADSIGKVKEEVSCGLLVQDDPEFVTISLSFAQETREYGHVISIPRVAIRRMWVFNRNPQAKPRAKKSDFKNPNQLEIFNETDVRSVRHRDDGPRPAGE